VPGHFRRVVAPALDLEPQVPLGSNLPPPHSFRVSPAHPALVRPQRLAVPARSLVSYA
jgi:hypothetical protein